MDNFYNSLSLVELLLKKNIFVCGTLRSHRGGPSHLKNVKKNMEINTIKQFQKNLINIFVFKSKKTKDGIAIISNFHNIHSKVVEKSLSIDTKNETLKISSIQNERSLLISSSTNKVNKIDLDSFTSTLPENSIDIDLKIENESIKKSFISIYC